MQRTMPEIWAYCDPCGRWFYPEAQDTAGAPACPVCSTEAVTLAEEPADATPGAAPGDG